MTIRIYLQLLQHPKIKKQNQKKTLSYNHNSVFSIKIKPTNAYVIIVIINAAIKRWKIKILWETKKSKREENRFIHENSEKGKQFKTAISKIIISYNDIKKIARGNPADSVILQYQYFR